MTEESLGPSGIPLPPTQVSLPEPSLGQLLQHAPAPSTYSPERAERILEHYTEGLSLAAICMLPDMPSYAAVLKWGRDNPAFKERLKGARELRALYFEEQALAEGTATVDKDDVANQRLKFDAYRWGAEVNDSSRYGRKTTVEGNPDKPLTFIISTGFPALTPEQSQPRLGADGLIAKDQAIDIGKAVVAAEMSDAPDARDPALPTPEDSGDTL